MSARLSVSKKQMMRRDCAGSAAVEFAMLIPLFLLLIFGVYEFGRIYWVQNTLQYAAEQTARCIIANPTVTSVASGTCALSNNTAGLTVSSSSAVSGNCSGALGTLSPIPQCMTVTATYSLPSSDPLTSIISTLVGMVRHRTPPNWSFSLSGQSTVPIS